MHLVPRPQPWAGLPTTDQAAQDPIDADLECLHGWGTQYIFEQPVPLPLSRKILPKSLTKSSLCTLKPFPFVLLLSDHPIVPLGLGISSSDGNPEG